MILRKYLAWLFSTAILVVFSSLVLPKGYNQIVDWIGPLLGGGGLRLELQLLFLFLGPSISYAPLLILWVAAGVVGGFFARGVLRSMAAGTISVLTLFVLLATNGFLIFKQLQSAGTGILNPAGLTPQGVTSGGANFPPPPEGFSIIDLLSAPLVDETVQQFTAGGTNPVGVVTMFVRNFLVNIILYALSFTLSGFIFSRILRRRSKRPVEARAEPEVSTSLTKILSRKHVILFLFVIVLLAGLYPASGSHADSVPTTPFQGEKMLLILSGDGSLGMAYYKNVTSIPGLPIDYQREEFRDLYGAILYAFQGLVECPSETLFLAALSTTPAYSYAANYFSVVPKNGFLAVYQVDDPSEGRRRADLLASEFGESFGLGLRFGTDVHIPPNSGGSIFQKGWYAAVYVGNGDATKIGSKVIELAREDGVGSIMTPEKVLQKHLGVAAGLFRLPVDDGSGKLFPAVGMLADLTPLSNFQGRGTFTLGLNEIFGVQGEIFPSTTSGTTQILLTFPSNVTIADYGPSNAIFHPEQGLMLLTLNATDSPISNMFITFDNVFPGRVKVDRRIDQTSFSRGTTVTETVTVTNLTNEPIQDVTVSEKRLFETYSTLRLVSPSSYEITIGEIPSNSLTTAEYRFQVQGEGVYTLPPVEVGYADDGEIVRRSSCPASIRSTFNYTMYAQEFMAATAPVSYVLITLAVLPPLIQVPKFVFRKKPVA